MTLDYYYAALFSLGVALSFLIGIGVADLTTYKRSR